MKTKPDHSIKSECCLALVEIDANGQAVCNRCNCECEVLTEDIEYYDECLADDERPFKSETE